MTRGWHYYIVSMDNGRILAPYITDDRDPGCYGMAVDTDVYQYNQATTPYTNQYRGYRQSFKWLLEPVGVGTNLVRFNNKSTGMYLAVKGDSRQAGAHLCQAKDGSIDWKLLGVGESNHADGYIIVNDLTGGRIAIPSSQPANEIVARQNMSRNGDTPETGWKLVNANRYESGKDAAWLPTFGAAGSGDNHHFKAAQHGPMRETILSARIDAVCSMIGRFPSRNEIEALYNTFLVAMRQLVRPAFVENGLVEQLLGEWSAVHTYLNAYKDSKNLQKLQKALVEAETVYARLTGRLMGSDVKEAGLILFLQAAAEHLATILAMESLSVRSAGQALKTTAQRYAAHLLDTFQQLKEKRMALITEYSFFGYKYADEYQRLRIISGRDEKKYHTFAEYREIMATHFDAEFGNPALLACSWTEQAPQGIRSLSWMATDGVDSQSRSSQFNLVGSSLQEHPAASDNRG